MRYTINDVFDIYCFYLLIFKQLRCAIRGYRSSAADYLGVLRYDSMSLGM